MVKVFVVIARCMFHRFLFVVGVAIDRSFLFVIVWFVPMLGVVLVCCQCHGFLCVSVCFSIALGYAL